MTSASTIFEVLNARHVAPDGVASTFVAPSQFQHLIRPRNSLLVGARGTGKTTLLKMLKAPALAAWDSAEKAELYNYLSYVSAFISNDRNWSARVNDFARNFESVELQQYARLAIISNQALRAMVTSASELFNNDMSMIPTFEGMASINRLEASVRFAQMLSADLFHGHHFVSTTNLHEFLGTRIDKFIEDCNAMRFVGVSEADVARNNRWIFSDFLAPLKKAGERFAECSSLYDLQWCLCFDELELSHPDVRNLLFTYLRGADPLFYFKLATIPFIEDLTVFHGLNAPTGPHDFSVIELWKVKKEEGDRFMKSLASAVLTQKGLHSITVEQLLGNSHEPTRRDNEAAEYPEETIGKFAFGSKFFDRFMALADLDETFREFLNSRGIGVRDFFRMTEDRRAAIFRKVQNIVVVRAAFWPRPRISTIRGNDKRPLIRRKASRGFVYAGWQNVIELCDNNPRFLLAVLDPLVLTFKRTAKTIAPEQQLSAVLEVSKQVASVLESEGFQAPYARMNTVYDLLRRLGGYFKYQIHGKVFNPDPVLSVKISSEAPDALVKAIGFAIREGAMLLEGEYTGAYFRDGIVNKRVRLSYIFAPDFQLPIMLGRHIQIEKILRFGNQERDASRSPSRQRDMFLEPKDV